MRAVRTVTRQHHSLEREGARSYCCGRCPPADAGRPASSVRPSPRSPPEVSYASGGLERPEIREAICWRPRYVVLIRQDCVEMVRRRSMVMGRA